MRCCVDRCLSVPWALFGRNGGCLLCAVKGHVAYSRVHGQLHTHTHTHTHTGKATKGKVQDIGEVNKVMPLPLPSSDRVRG